jgi:hypothetical protein
MSPRPRRAPTALLICAVLAAAVPAMAGPPLLCHPFDIGTARSLPWGDVTSWLASSPGYRTSGLVTDVEALLVPSTPVVVRMETLRRAAIYAGGDPKAAAALFSALGARARGAAPPGRAAALAHLDAAYYTEALRQVSQMDRHPGFRDASAALRAVVGTTDGYSLAARALVLNPDDPAMQFEAALIALGSHREAYQGHAEKARAGAARDVLLARNIEHVQ